MYWLLEAANYSQPAAPVEWKVRDVAPAERDPSVGKRQQPGDDVDQSGFARSVGADNSKNVAWLQAEADLVEDLEPAKLFGNGIDMKLAPVGRILGSNGCCFGHVSYPISDPAARPRGLRAAGSVSPSKLMQTCAAARGGTWSD